MTPHLSPITRTGPLPLAMTHGAASAIEWRTGDTVTVTRPEVIQDDLYVAGDDVWINGTVNGDVFAAARTVTIAGDVRGTVFAAAETLTLAGKVSPSARLAGSTIRLQEGASVIRDLLAPGSGIPRS